MSFLEWGAFQLAKAAQNLPQKLSDDILEFIISRHMKPGDKLPNETVFSKHLNAGRSSVREAMKLLVSKNIVEIRQGSGTYVSSRMGVCDDPLGLVFLGDSPKLIYDLIEIRLLVEPTVAAMAAYNRDEDDVKKITRLCNETEKLILSGENLAQADILFHQAIAYSSKNMVIPRLVPIISHTIETVAELASPSVMEDAIISHHEITNAIAARDQVAAKDAMYLHLIQNRRVISKVLCHENPQSKIQQQQ